MYEKSSAYIKHDFFGKQKAPHLRGFHNDCKSVYALVNAYRKLCVNLRVKLLDSKSVLTCNAVSGIAAVSIFLCLISKRILILVADVLKDSYSICYRDVFIKIRIAIQNAARISTATTTDGSCVDSRCCGRSLYCRSCCCLLLS